mmetsp:Transcript_46606/g.109613  ORF Transcript_46606/g.109613 Transcript_46606/m.109613 type:complete len:330 (+) Transcript_46606:643-1632(+)
MPVHPLPDHRVLVQVGMDFGGGAELGDAVGVGRLGVDHGVDEGLALDGEGAHGLGAAVREEAGDGGLVDQRLASCVHAVRQLHRQLRERVWAAPRLLHKPLAPVLELQDRQVQVRDGLEVVLVGSVDRLRELRRQVALEPLGLWDPPRHVTPRHATTRHTHHKSLSRHATRHGSFGSALPRSAPSILAPLSIPAQTLLLFQSSLLVAISNHRLFPSPRISIRACPCSSRSFGFSLARCTWNAARSTIVRLKSLTPRSNSRSRTSAHQFRRHPVSAAIAFSFSGAGLASASLMMRSNCFSSSGRVSERYPFLSLMSSGTLYQTPLRQTAM